MPSVYKRSMFENTKVIAIAAIDEKRGIGKDNQLLYHCREDLQRFRKLTENETIVYGHTTLLTFPNQQPLKNRRNIILTHDTNITVQNAVMQHSISQLDRYCNVNQIPSLFVTGGESVYREMLPYCSVLYLTIFHEVRPADRYFPAYDTLFSRSFISETKEENGIIYHFEELRKV